MANIFETILKTKNLVAPILNEGINWFRQKIMGLQNVTPQKIINKIEKEAVIENVDTKSKTRFINQITNKNTGQMFLFRYDPKLKDKLPYYDTFPLIFPLDVKMDRFLGLNMHYLHPMYRAKLMDEFYKLANNDKLDESTKIIMSYKLLKGTSSLRYYKPCIKEYLVGHVRSKYMYIDPKEWEKILFLPLAQWKKKTSSQVYSITSKEF